MLNSNKTSPAKTLKEQTSVFEFHGSSIAVEEINGILMFNATQMAKPFGKRPVDYLYTQQSKDLIKTISKVRKITLAEIQQVRRGGNNPGTWFNKELSLLFAQWLSPEFYLACNQKLEEILTQKSITIFKIVK